MKKTVGVAAAVVGLLFAAQGTAHADNYLTPGEISVGDGMSDALCEYIGDNGVTMGSMTNAARVIYQQDEIANMGDAVDVINYVVSTYCPDYWRELVSFGDAMRNG